MLPFRAELEKSMADVPHLTEEWHKARRAYTLAGGLLLGWELIGFKVTEANVPGDLKLEIDAPDALPLALMALTLFNGVRASIEWYQCDPRRRAFLPATADYYLSHGLAAFALYTYVSRRLLDQPLGFILSTSPAFLTWQVAFAVGAGLSYAILPRRPIIADLPVFRYLDITDRVFIGGLALIGGRVLAGQNPPPGPVIGGLVTGVVAVAGWWFTFHRPPRK